jgi:hypothetical protein
MIFDFNSNVNLDSTINLKVVYDPQLLFTKWNRGTFGSILHTHYGLVEKDDLRISHGHGRWPEDHIKAMIKRNPLQIFKGLGYG